jgi:acyl carrier protein
VSNSKEKPPVDRAEVLLIVHKTAAELAAVNNPVTADDPVGDEADNLLLRYGFNSLDALEYLLVLEEKFGITFEDEDLTEDVLSSADALVSYIMVRQDVGMPG